MSLECIPDLWDFFEKWVKNVVEIELSGFNLEKWPSPKNFRWSNLWKSASDLLRVDRNLSEIIKTIFDLRKSSTLKLGRGLITSISFNRYLGEFWPIFWYLAKYVNNVNVGPTSFALEIWPLDITNKIEVTVDLRGLTRSLHFTLQEMS